MLSTHSTETKKENTPGFFEKIDAQIQYNLDISLDVICKILKDTGMSIENFTTLLSTGQIFLGLSTSATATNKESALTGAALCGSGLFGGLYAIDPEHKNMEAKDYLKNYLIQSISGSVYQLTCGIATYASSKIDMKWRIAVNAGGNVIATFLGDLTESFFKRQELKNGLRDYIDAAVAGAARSISNITVSKNISPLVQSGKQNMVPNMLISASAQAVGGALVGATTKLLEVKKVDKGKEKSMVATIAMEAANAAALGAVEGCRKALL